MVGRGKKKEKERNAGDKNEDGKVKREIIFYLSDGKKSRVSIIDHLSPLATEVSGIEKHFKALSNKGIIEKSRNQEDDVEYELCFTYTGLKEALRLFQKRTDMLGLMNTALFRTISMTNCT